VHARPRGTAAGGRSGERCRQQGLASVELAEADIAAASARLPEEPCAASGRTWSALAPVNLLEVVKCPRAPFSRNRDARGPEQPGFAATLMSSTAFRQLSHHQDIDAIDQLVSEGDTKAQLLVEQIDVVVFPRLPGREVVAYLTDGGTIDLT